MQSNFRGLFGGQLSNEAVQKQADQSQPLWKSHFTPQTNQGVLNPTGKPRAIHVKIFFLSPPTISKNNKLIKVCPKVILTLLFFHTLNVFQTSHVYMRGLFIHQAGRCLGSVTQNLH